MSSRLRRPRPALRRHGWQDSRERQLQAESPDACPLHCDHPPSSGRAPLQNNRVVIHSVNPDSSGSLIFSNHQTVSLVLQVRIASLDTVLNLCVPKKAQ